MKDTPVDSIYRTFEVFFLAHHSLLAVKENVAHLITQAFSDLTKAEKAHLQSIAHRDAKGNLTHWSQDGHQMKRTIEIVSRFTVPSTKK